jgi:hypothetical protein
VCSEFLSSGCFPGKNLFLYLSSGDLVIYSILFSITIFLIKIFLPITYLIAMATYALSESHKDVRLILDESMMAMAS